MATIEILSGDFERDSTRIRYSEAGRAYLRLRSLDGHVEDLFLENEVVGSAEAGDGHAASARGRCAIGRSQELHLFVVLLRGGRKFVARGDYDAMVEFETAPLPADQRRERLAHLQAARLARSATATVTGPATWFGPGFLARLLPGR